MKVVGICASPRKQGNTDLLLDMALKGAKEAGALTEKFFLADMDISPISEKEYEGIDPGGFSPVHDDMHAIYKAILGADAIVFASPIFFGSLSTQAKMMIDRFQCVWISKFFHGREIYTRNIKGVFLSVEATGREDFFDNARSIVKHFFATIKAEYCGEVLAPGCDRKGSIMEKADLLEKAHRLGRELAA